LEAYNSEKQKKRYNLYIYYCEEVKKFKTMTKATRAKNKRIDLILF